MRSTKIAPDLSSVRSRVSETVSTAMRSGTNCLLSSMPGMEAPLRPHSCDAANVLQLAIAPDCSPALNQRWRCCALPCVKLSGTT